MKIQQILHEELDTDLKIGSFGGLQCFFARKGKNEFHFARQLEDRNSQLANDAGLLRAFLEKVGSAAIQQRPENPSQTKLEMMIFVTSFNQGVIVELIPQFRQLRFITCLPMGHQFAKPGTRPVIV